MPNKRKRLTHAGYKARKLAYKTENRRNKNKELKLLKHLLKHPNDKQSENREVPKNYTRKKPILGWLGYYLSNKPEEKKSKNFSHRRK